jgi:hypothetical protein
MRILALRTIIGWWMIPTFWIACWPLMYLMFDFDEANEMCSELSNAVWNGVC